MKTVIIVNPTSGRLKYPRQVEWLQTQLDRSGFNPLVTVTRGSLEATRSARQAAGEGADLIISVGGDGTLNEVINGIAGSASILGIVPVGWRNVLARELGIPSKLTEALNVIRRGMVRKIDLGQVNNRWFALMVGVGLDAQAVKTVNLKLKRYLGGYAYHLAGLKSLFSFKPMIFRVILNGKKELGGYAAIISNARYYGGPHQVNPAARVDDGFLHLCLFERGRKSDHARYFWGVVRKHLHRYPDVCFRKIKEITIPEAGLPVQADGDFIGYTPLRIRIRPRILPVLVPSKVQSNNCRG